MERGFSTVRCCFFLALVLAQVTFGFPEPTRARPRQQEDAQSSTSSAAPSASSSADSDLANFGQKVNVLGSMERTDQDFVDGLALDLFSPSNRTLIVNRNNSPLSGSYVTGTTGEPFVALSSYSYIVQFNETANDLIAKIELPYDPSQLKAMGIDQGDTYVGTLAADKKSWVISESQRNVHVSENKTRIIKMTSLDGEYLLLGRKTVDISNIFVQYGQGATRTVNVTGGPGTQEAEFIDGLRFTVESDQALTMNADIRNGVPTDVLPPNFQSLNSFSWVVNTSMPTQEVRNADLRVPFNRAILTAKTNNAENAEKKLTVAKRPLNATSELFKELPSDSQTILASEDRIKVSNVKQLDGQYVLLFS